MSSCFDVRCTSPCCVTTVHIAGQTRSHTVKTTSRSAYLVLVRCVHRCIYAFVGLTLMHGRSTDSRSSNLPRKTCRTSENYRTVRVFLLWGCYVSMCASSCIRHTCTWGTCLIRVVRTALVLSRPRVFPWSSAIALKIVVRRDNCFKDTRLRMRGFRIFILNIVRVHAMSCTRVLHYPDH